MKFLLQGGIFSWLQSHESLIASIVSKGGAIIQDVQHKHWKKLETDLEPLIGDNLPLANDIMDGLKDLVKDPQADLAKLKGAVVNWVKLATIGMVTEPPSGANLESVAVGTKQLNDTKDGQTKIAQMKSAAGMFKLLENTTWQGKSGAATDFYGFKQVKMLAQDQTKNAKSGQSNKKWAILTSVCDGHNEADCASGEKVGLIIFAGSKDSIDYTRDAEAAFSTQCPPGSSSCSRFGQGFVTGTCETAANPAFQKGLTSLNEYGATKVFLIGHSLGAAEAIVFAYGASGDSISCAGGQDLAKLALPVSNKIHHIHSFGTPPAVMFDADPAKQRWNQLFLHMNKQDPIALLSASVANMRGVDGWAQNSMVSMLTGGIVPLEQPTHNTQAIYYLTEPKVSYVNSSSKTLTPLEAPLVLRSGSKDGLKTLETYIQGGAWKKPDLVDTVIGLASTIMNLDVDAHGKYAERMCTIAFGNDKCDE